MSNNHRIQPEFPDDVKQTIPYIQKLFRLLLIHIGLLISMLMMFFITSKYSYLNVLWLVLFNTIMIGGMLWFHNSFIKKKIRLFLLTEEL